MLADPTTVNPRFDPTQQRLYGITNHKRMVIDVPVISEIAPNLWQGGFAHGMILPRNISHLLSLYIWGQYKVQHKLRTRHEVKMYDALDQDPQVDRWARWVNARRRTGAVLVHCEAGLNRSGLVVARSLMLEGMSAADAIALQREKRSPAVLCNQAFEDYLLSL
jgi:protein-tyrosine phosphatase